VAWVALSWRSVEAAHPDTPALAVLGNVLGGGLTSRLYQALVESNLTLSITVVPWQLRDPALFSIFAPVRPGVAAATVETVIREETARLSASGVTDAEVRKAQTQIEAEIVFDRDSTDQIAASLSEAIAVADWQWYVDYPAAVARVTTEDVRRVAQSTFRGEALTVGVFQPRDPGGAAAEDGAPEPGGEEAS